MVSPRLLLVPLLLAACGEAASTPPPERDGGLPEDAAAGSPDAGAADAGAADAGDGCPPPSVRGPGGACTASLGAWSSGTELPRGFDHHGTVVTTGTAGAFLHAIGGNDYARTYADVFSAPIAAADGSIGEWAMGPPLSSPRAGIALAGDGRHVVIAGGRAAVGRDLTEVWIAPVLPSGRLGDWQPGPPLPATRFHGTLALERGVVYAIGGLFTTTATNTVFAATLSAAGTLSGWRAERALPGPRSHHASVIHGSGLYLIGGLAGNPAGNALPLRDVIRAEIAQDGALGPWVEVGALPNAYGTHSAVVVGDEVWVLGGVVDNASFTDRVLRARIAADGKVGEFEEAGDLPRARSHVHQTPVFGRWIYSVGGSNNHQLTRAVDIGELF